MDVKSCCNALEQALEKYGKPEIVNSDQGNQFTSKDFTQRSFLILRPSHMPVCLVFTYVSVQF